MSLAPLTADLSATLADGARLVAPRLPVAGGAAQVVALTPEDLAGLAPTGTEFAVTLPVSGAVTGELTLLVTGDAPLTGPGGAAQLAQWEPALADLVAGLGGPAGAVTATAARPVDARTALVAVPGHGRHGVALVDGTSPVAVLVLTVTPGSGVPLQRAAEPAVFQPLAGTEAPVDTSRLHLLRDVVMELSVELGRTRMTVRELLSLTPGTIVQLDRAAGSPVDLLVNGSLLARGEVVVVDEEFAVRVTEIVGPEAEGRPGA